MAKRLFVAIDPPDSITDALQALDPKVRGVKWVSPKQMHLTLGFFGSVPPESLEDLKTRLSAIHFGSFFLPVQGLGAFPAKGSPKIIWIGVGKGHPHLFQIHKRVQEAAIASGLEPDLRPWHPHITLARCRDVSRQAVRTLLAGDGIEVGMFPVQAFHLYSSQLTPAGAIYTCELSVQASQSLPGAR
jgi:RNA 2',3'-cyclic 3'-phosphodiesterase